MSAASSSAAASSTPIPGAPGSAEASVGQSFSTFIASLGTAVALFGAQLALFVLLSGNLSRIYRPRTFLVPERERIAAPPKGPWQWIKPVFQTSNSAFIEKCGLDAYFFLRYLRTLLKIFIPMAIIILPILLPINYVHGKGANFADNPTFKGYTKGKNATDMNVNGLDQFAWGNIRPDKTHRYWAHLILAIGVITWVCFVLFGELRGYIRLRQAYLTSPQHRLRASATTVLVTAIPPKWCTFEALNGLYDVFPGGIRNIWINRNFDELNDKVKRRKKIASALEAAETNLVKNAKKAQMKKVKEETKKVGNKGLHSDTAKTLDAANNQGLAMAQTDGISSGDPHQVRHTLDEALADSSGEPSRDYSPDRKKPLVPIPVLGQGIEAVGQGIGALGKTVFGGFKSVERDVDERLHTTGGLVVDDSGLRAAPAEPRPSNVSFGLDGGRSRSKALDSNHEGVIHEASNKRDYDLSDRQSSNESTVRQSTSQDDPPYARPQANHNGQGLGIQGATVERGVSSDSPDMDVLRNPQRLGEVGETQGSKFKFCNRTKITPYGIPSPTPHGQEEDEFPLSRPSPMTPGCNPQATINGCQSPDDRTRSLQKPIVKQKEDAKKKAKTYPEAYFKDYDPTEGKPAWKEYLKEDDRETMRLPIFGWQWMFSLPLLGKKVDKINYCREELARLNVEIETDQQDPESYPLMNSAFVQFNHQVAAHMACQSVSHHTPDQMAPRIVEISPDDVIWDNMSIKWWESYIRTGAVMSIFIGLIIGWAFPVAFTGVLSQTTQLADKVNWLHWFLRLPGTIRNLIQGDLAPGFLSLLLVLMPIIIRLLAKAQGGHTGMTVELIVQQYYFAFLFVEVFLVVSVSSGLTTVLKSISNQPQEIPSILATNLPKASNYFFSYLLLQALSTSAGALSQVMSLIKWFILAPLLDNTARQKWRRQTSLPDVQWGSFFPVYTNFACIGLIYSVVSPLILIFNLITFSLFWLVYRYNTLYVTRFRFDTGGLLYPTAINQLFTGLYFMELCLIGLFFLVESYDPEHNKVTPAVCKIQAIIMIVVMVITAIFQLLLNLSFAPLFRYLPITLEDEAVERDEAFARAQEKRWMLEENEQESEDINETLKKRERRSQEEEQNGEQIEMQKMDGPSERGRLDPRRLGNIVPEAVGTLVPIKVSWADRSRQRNSKTPGTPGHAHVASPRHHHQRHPQRRTPDVEAQRSGTNAIGEALFSGINDEIEDLTPEERDKLVQRAFQHEALRARRPVVWIPRDDLGVSDDEIRRTRELTKNIWISNEFTGLDGKGRVVYRRSPPDFSEVDLIEL